MRVGPVSTNICCSSRHQLAAMEVSVMGEAGKGEAGYRDSGHSLARDPTVPLIPCTGHDRNPHVPRARVSSQPAALGVAADPGSIHIPFGTSRFLLCLDQRINRVPHQRQRQAWRQSSTFSWLLSCWTWNWAGQWLPADSTEEQSSHPGPRSTWHPEPWRPCSRGPAFTLHSTVVTCQRESAWGPAQPFHLCRAGYKTGFWAQTGTSISTSNSMSMSGNPLPTST